MFVKPPVLEIYRTGVDNALSILNCHCIWPYFELQLDQMTFRGLFQSKFYNFLIWNYSTVIFGSILL